MTAKFRTKRGMPVFVLGMHVVDCGHTKVHCYRTPSGAYHGLLVLKRLTPMNAAAESLVDSAERMECWLKRMGNE